MSNQPPQSVTTSIQPPFAAPFPRATKRTRGDNNDIVLSDTRHIKRSKRQKVNSEVQQHLDLDNNINVAIGRMDTHLLADYVAQHTKRFQTGLSAVELKGLHIPGMLAFWIFKRKCPRIYALTDPYRKRLSKHQRLDQTQAT